MKQENFILKINNSYNQIIKQFNDADNRMEIYSQISTIRLETERKIDGIGESYKETLYELADFFESYSNYNTNKHSPKIDHESIRMISERDFWDILQNDSGTVLNFTTSLRDEMVLEDENLRIAFTTILDKIDRLIKTAEKLYATYMSAHLAIDLINDGGFDKPLPKADELNGIKTKSLPPAALKRIEISNKMFNEHKLKLANAIKEKLNGAKISDFLTPKGYINKTFLDNVHRLYENKDDLSINTLSNWLGSPDRRKELNEIIKNLP